MVLKLNLNSKKTGYMIEGIELEHVLSVAKNIRVRVLFKYSWTLFPHSFV